MTPNTQNKNKSEDKNKNPGQTHPGQGNQDLADRAKDAASSMADRAKDAASAVADRAKDAASAVQDKAEHAANYVGKKAEDATSAVGGGLKSLGQTIREKTPHSGMMGNASSAVADSLESTGRYLEEEGLQGMAEDVTNLIRRNPIPALLIGIGAGFLLARAMTPRR